MFGNKQKYNFVLQPVYHKISEAVCRRPIGVLVDEQEILEKDSLEVLHVEIQMLKFQLHLFFAEILLLPNLPK